MDASAKPPSKVVAYPPRDEDGRVMTLPDLLGGFAVSAAVGFVLVLAVDALFTLLGVGPFGHVSGWLGGILAVWLFVEDFRAWKGAVIRIAVAFVAAALGLLAGAPLSAALGLPALFSGMIGFTVAGVIYAVVWFFGIRFVASRLGER